MDYKVRLDVFEGPLDLLLYLIKKNELDIHDIPVNVITEQYLEYLNLMQLLDLDVAGEFLVMAATLMHIKSKMLLPPEEKPAEEAEEEDPREELVRKLLEYKRFKEAASQLAQREADRGRFFTRYPGALEIDGGDSPFLEASLFDLISAFSKILKGLPKETFHRIIKDEFTVAEKVHEIFHLLVQSKSVFFSTLFEKSKNRFEAITIFLALLELIRLKEIAVVQNRLFGDIEIMRNADNIAPRPPERAPGPEAP
jgi:segregation and condensation protein A